MPENPLIVPVLSAAGTVYFASVAQNATARDVITSLVQSREVQEDYLGGIHDVGWDLQKVRKEEPGRVWEEDELEHLGLGKPT